VRVIRSVAAVSVSASSVSRSALSGSPKQHETADKFAARAEDRRLDVVDRVAAARLGVVERVLLAAERADQLAKPAVHGCVGARGLRELGHQHADLLARRGLELDLAPGGARTHGGVAERGAVGRRRARPDAREPGVEVVRLEVGGAEDAERRHERQALARARAHVQPLRTACVGDDQQRVGDVHRGQALQAETGGQLGALATRERHHGVLVERRLAERNRAEPQAVGPPPGVPVHVAVARQHRQHGVHRRDVHAQLLDQLAECEVLAGMGGQEVEDVNRAAGGKCWAGHP
jgi:hypothetical protein